MKKSKSLVIGGGFYGCIVALELARHRSEVLMIESECDLMRRASLNNQARIHQGYHYPRSLLTAARSHANYTKFVDEFRECIFDQFDHYYAIAVHLSKVSAAQFSEFCRRIGAPLRPAPTSIKKLFAAHLIEDVFAVTECAFDAIKLKTILRNRLEEAGIKIFFNSTAQTVRDGKSGRLICHFTGADGRCEVEVDEVFNCTYASLNLISSASDIEPLPLKLEFTEMALVELPEPLKSLGVTVMDGPFFSFLPFPSRGLHTLSHVRYTPHGAWIQGPAGFGKTVSPIVRLAELRPESNGLRMIRDASRYLPLMAEAKYKDSLWEVKAILPQSEFDDSRPIVFQQSRLKPGFLSVMGGKIDNVADIRAELNQYFVRAA